MAREKEATKEVKDKDQPGISVEALVRAEIDRAMGDLQTRIASQVTGLEQLAPAYIKAVFNSNDAVKNATNPHLRNTYADLGSVLAAVRDAFLSNGLWLLQCPGEMTMKDGRPYVSMHGHLIHTSGQSIGFKMELPAFSLSKSGELVLNPQTTGSALAYARRYMWNAVAGITQVDDDGDEASYNDGAQGPAREAKREAPQSSDGDAVMLKKIADASSMDELKALREAAQALKSKKVTDAYMAKRETFQS